MTQNLGTIDRILRAGVAIGLAVLALTGVVQGVLAIVAWVVAAVFLITSIVGVCPAYRLVGVNTCGAG